MYKSIQQANTFRTLFTVFERRITQFNIRVQWLHRFLTGLTKFLWGRESKDEEEVKIKEDSTGRNYK